MELLQTEVVFEQSNQNAYFQLFRAKLLLGHQISQLLVLHMAPYDMMYLKRKIIAD